MNSKRKGSSGERELLKILSDAGIDAHRNDQRFISGWHNPDIEARFAGVTIHCECKRREHLNIYDAIEQAVRDADGQAFPIVAHRSNRKCWLVTCRLSDLLDQIK